MPISSPPDRCPVCSGRLRPILEIDARKHGRFRAGTGHEVLPPEAVGERAPDVVRVRNRRYHDEFRRTLATLGSGVSVLAV
jgi:hypothetical protein